MSKLLNDGNALPSMIIFDLDFTLWPLDVAAYISPPLTAVQGGRKIRAGDGDEYGLCPEGLDMLAAIKDKGIRIACASRTIAPSMAREFLSLLKINDEYGTALDVMEFIEMHDDEKRIHMRRIHKDSGVPFTEMLFFDDEPRNKIVEKLGVTMLLVDDGVSFRVLDAGIEQWRRAMKKA